MKSSFTLFVHIVSLIFYLNSNAQQIELYEQFFGKYDYVAIGNTLNIGENNFGPCTMLTQSSATLNLSADQTVVAAYLYWAGSSFTADFDVKLNGIDISAERTFSSSLLINDMTLSYFGGFTDVTTIVQDAGNGEYTFSDMDLNTGLQVYCNSGQNFGGWSIIVIYEDPVFINNLVNVYDGFEVVAGFSPLLEIQLEGINVIDPQGGKIGFLAWEGDASVAINETLQVNGNILSNPPLNPATNVFNGTNSFTGDTNLYNMDLDFFDISDYVNPGDSTLDVTLTTGQDLVFVNNIVVILSSELPDATITADPNVQGDNSCGNRDLDVDFTVTNTDDGTDILPAGIPIAFYADGVLVATTQTSQILEVGDSVSQSHSFTIPDTIPNLFVLTIVVDDIGDGTGIQQEVNEDNNTYTLNVILLDALEEAEITNQEACSDTNTATFDLMDSVVFVNPDYNVSFYSSLSNAQNNVSAFTDYTEYQGATGTVYIRVQDPATSCYMIYDFELIVNQKPALNNNVQDYNVCIDGTNQTTVFNLTSKQNEVLQEQVATISYHTSQQDADNNVGVIPNPENYTNVSNPQMIYVRAQFYPNCYNTTSFELNVYQNPEIITPTNYLLCDDDGNGSESFNLSTKIDEIQNGQDGVQVTFHNSQDNALAGNPFVGNETNYNSSGETVWVRAENTDGCFVVTTLELVVVSLPDISQPSVYEICSNTSDTAVFNLNSKNYEMSQGQPYIFSYYETLSDAQNEIVPIPNPANYTNISNPQTIYVRIENQQGCYVLTQFDLLVSEYPEAFQPNDLVVCDDNNDGYAIFDLTILNSEVTGGEPNTTVVFHETYDDLVHDANAISNPQQYFNLSPGNQTIYIAVVSTGGTCRSFTSVNLIVLPKPQITKNVPALLEECEDSDGIAQFDLTDALADIMNTLDISLHTITYHLSENEARNNANAIPNFTNYPSASGSVWVRVEDNDTGCFDVVELILIVNPLPVVSMPEVDRYVLCDDDNDGYMIFDLETQIAGIINGQAGLTVTFHDTYADAESGSSPYSYIHQNNEPFVETVFVRVETEKGCFVITLMDLVVEPLPVLVPPTEPVAACDGDGDGFGEVDFTDTIEQMLNRANPDDYLITIHETIDDAEIGAYPIEDLEAYQNIEGFVQVVYLRIQTISGEECFDIYPITINVAPAPQLPVEQDGTLPDIVICDENTDGYAYFDFTGQTQYILDAQDDITDLEVTYHLNEQNAVDGVLAITTVTNYRNIIAFQQTVWVRIENTLTGCFDTAPFDLIVNLPLELPVPPAITLCDEDMDGNVEYNLTIRIPDILANAANPNNFTVDFFTSYAAAVAGDETELIPDYSSYWSSLHVQTLGVRVTNNTTGCESYTILDIRRAPMPNVPTAALEPIEGCQESHGSLTGIFDLTQRENFIRQGDNNLVITYHLTFEQAETGSNAIEDPENYVSVNTTIYIRIANPPNGGTVCARVLEVEIIVNPIPVVADNAFEVCQTGSTGYAEFYFPDFNPDLLGPTQDLEDFSIAYYHSQTDAENQNGAINQTVPYTNTQHGSEDLWVRITNNQTGCFVIEQITLYAEEAAQATQPADNRIFECDDWDGANDGFVTGIDLTVFESQILTGTHPYQIFYHTDEYEANQGLNAVPNPANFTNTVAGGQTIWVRVENSNTTAPCYELVTLELIIEQPANPVISSDNNVLCVDWGATVANNPVILDSGVSNTGYTFEWYHNGILLAGETQSTLTLNNLGEEGFYTVIAISDNGCISEMSDEFEVILSGAPEIVSITTTNAFQDQQSVIVTVQGNGTYAYQLNDGPLQETGYFTNVPAGVHTVTVYDISSGDINQFNSCGNLVIDDIQLIDYPKFFTPNGDGYNDNWNIIGLTESHNAEIYIFDRYGKLIKQLNPAGDGWDGTYNGQQVPSTDYWFKVFYDEEDANNNTQRREFKAHFSLKR